MTSSEKNARNVILRFQQNGIGLALKLPSLSE
jgi:hypothetical protein